MQKITALLAGIFVFLLSAGVVTAQTIRIIPQPAEIAGQYGAFSFTNATSIAHHGNTTEARFLQTYLLHDFQLDVPLNKKADKGVIELLLDKKLLQTLGEEGYQLNAGNDRLVITAATSTGIFYGIQSLRQLIRKHGDHFMVNGVRITDKPRFGWRAFMLDEARHFQGEQVVKKMLDEMARLKMNVFHWHLTDDQGWRIDIKKYPLLAKVGGRRDSTQVAWRSPNFDGKVHEGYYTQDQIKNIIQYAAQRHINIVPEIEMPGHASAAIAAYPWLGVTNTPIKVPGKFGVLYDVFNVADPKVVGFLKDVLTEVIALFPSKVIHIGGDEVKFDQWKADANVQAYMKSHNLATPADLQISFTNEISNFLAGKNRRMIGWNEIMGSKLHEYTNAADANATQKLAPGTIVQFWKGELNLVTDAVSKGYDVVNSYHAMTYLDYDYKTISLEKAYSFDPIPEGLDPKYHAKILGSGCQMWGEWIPDEAAMNAKVFPRLGAYAEDGWTLPANKNFEAFSKVVATFW